MAKSLEELSVQLEKMVKQFTGFQTMMQDSLDSLNAMGSWQSTVDKAFGDLRERADGTVATLAAITKRIDLAASRVDSQETWLTMAPTTAPLPHGTTKVVDLNLDPGTSTSSPARDRE